MTNSSNDFKADLDHYRSQQTRGYVGTDDPDDTGRFKAVFTSGPQGTQKEEDYISRMILRDREANVG